MSEQLPTIVRFLGTIDAGAAAPCPHCGATGRWIVRFQVRDGRQLGAMRGCVKRFPVSRLAREHQRLVDKAARYAAQRPPWKLNQQDQAALDAVEAAIDGRYDEHAALVLAENARGMARSRFRSRAR